MKPDIVDKINMDQVVDDYGDMYGVNPKIIVPDDVVAEIRAQRAAQAQQAQAGAAAAEMAKMSKDASGAEPGKLRDVMNMFAGYGSPSAVEV